MCPDNSSEIYLKTADFSSGPIPRESIRSMMRSGNLEIRALAFEYVTLYKYSERIQPPLEYDEKVAFILNFLEQSIQENLLDDEHIPSREDALDMISIWFGPAPTDESDECLRFYSHLKERLAHIYQLSGIEIRNAIIYHTLKYIFKEQYWRDFFQDWLDSPLLKEAYEQGIQWADAFYSQKPIPIHTIRSWMQNPDMEIRDAAIQLVTYQPYAERIEPQLSIEELESFLLPYYEYCLIEDIEEGKILTRYETAREIVSWYRAVPAEEDINSQELLLDLKLFLEKIYKAGDESLKNAVITGALEHIFEETRWRDFFSDWLLDSELKEAYLEAMKWAVHHTIE